MVEPASQTKPHVVIIMADQLRFDAIGKYTPRINELRNESVVFERSYCASPLCVPARGAFFSGQYPNLTGCLINPWEMLEREHGFVRAGTTNLFGLMEGEWDSWHVGKNHYFNEDSISEQPDAKTHWQPSNAYNQHLQAMGKKKPGSAPSYRGLMPETAFGTTTRVMSYSLPTTGRYEGALDDFYDGFIANSAVEAIRSRDRDKSLLLNAMFLAPHPPLEIPEPWYSLVKDADLPANVGQWSPNQSPLQLYNLTGMLGVRYSREDWERIWPVYLGLVHLLDHCVGMIIQELKEQGLYDDTLIVFTSDHGEMLGSHCLWQKMCMYEEAARTPLFFKFPQSYEPKVRHSTFLTSAVDVFPTLCDFLGLEISKPVSGVSLMPILEGDAIDRDHFFIQFDGNGARGHFQRCVIRGEYKLIVDMFRNEVYLELYNVAKDPQELDNLAFNDTYRETIGELLEILSNHMEATNDLLRLSPNVYQSFIESYSPFRGTPIV